MGNRPTKARRLISNGSKEPGTEQGFSRDGKQKMCWVDQESGCKCVMLYARELAIVWKEEPKYWRWLPETEPSGVTIDVAALIDVCWLEVNGSFNTANLTPNHLYEVVFVVKIQDPAYGWGEPVKLTLGGGAGVRYQEHMELLMDLPRGKWSELVVGSFVPTTAEEVPFSLIEIYGGHWKRGLVVKGVVIRPKKQVDILNPKKQ